MNLNSTNAMNIQPAAPVHTSESNSFDTSSESILQRDRWKSLATTFTLLVAVIAATLLVYTSALSGAFLFDDLPNIVDNRSIRTGQFFGLSSTRQLTMASFALNYRWSELSTGSFHWFNNSVHAFAAGFLFLLLVATFNQPSMGRISAPRFTAFCIALLWSVHPLNTQAVTYIVQRAESMMGLAFFGFLWLLAKSNESRQQWRWLAPAFAVLLAGLGCKEVMVTALPVGLIYDRVFLSNSWKQLPKVRGWFWGVCFGTIALAGLRFIPILIASQGGVGFSLASVTPLEYLRTQPQIILHYLQLVVWPDPLIFDYGWPPENRVWMIASSAGILLATIIVATIALICGNKWWAAPLCALIVLVPTSSFAPLQDLAAEHRMYVPMAIVLATLVVAFFKLSEHLFQEKAQLLSGGVCCLLIILLALKTMERNQVYGSPILMWKDVIAKTVEGDRPTMFAARAYSNLGEAYADHEQWDESLEVLQKAAVYPNFPSRVHGNLARGYLARGQFDLAAKHALIAFELEPQSARLRQQAGLIAAAKQDYDSAVGHFRAALEIDRSDAVIMVNLAQALIAKKELAEAGELLEHAIEVDSKQELAYERLIIIRIQEKKFAEAQTVADQLQSRFPPKPDRDAMIGNLYAAMGDQAEALKRWEAAAATDHPPHLINLQLGDLHRKQGNASLAEKYYERELAVNAQCIEALNNLAGLVAQRDPSLAIRYFERVVKLAPDYLQAEFNIAAIYASQGQNSNARAQLESILAKRPDFAPARDLLAQLP